MTDWRVEPKDGPGVTGGTSAKAMVGFLQSIERQKKMMAALMRMLGGAQ